MKPNHKGSAQLFQNPILEKMTRTHIAMPISIFILIAIGLIYYGLAYSLINVLEAVGFFFLGWFIFTLIEYLAHRYLFHMDTSTPGRARMQYIVHGNHHDYPKDKKRLAMPPVVSILYASAFFFFFKLFFGQFVFGLVAGMLFGYAMYLSVHYAVHAYAPPKNFLKTLWIHHSIHHYKDPHAAYGVSSPLWDYLLGTMPKRNR
ncbi:sterol desaturase family protein [Pontibacter liquoris]|uniref:sterol desaturase family protein n=1 Tax=Pontibacter liquoris TaxID=2905677 RepID=UPI001FA70CEF|nr:sterol desaturase family protein [Pontibacter liquoris]